MTLIIEDGTGLANAEAYASVAYCDQYHSDRGNTLWATDMTTDQKEQSIRRAADFMSQTYRTKWLGFRRHSTQALDWPRVGVVVDKFVVVLDSVVPDDIKKANAELAFKGAFGDLNTDQTQGVIRKKVDGIEIEFDKNSPQTKKILSALGMLTQYLSGGGSSVLIGINRV